MGVGTSGVWTDVETNGVWIGAGTSDVCMDVETSDVREPMAIKPMQMLAQQQQRNKKGRKRKRKRKKTRSIHNLESTTKGTAITLAERSNALCHTHTISYFTSEQQSTPVHSQDDVNSDVQYQQQVRSLQEPSIKTSQLKPFNLSPSTSPALKRPIHQ